MSLFLVIKENSASSKKNTLSRLEFSNIGRE